MRVVRNLGRQARQNLRKGSFLGGENSRDSGDRIASNQAISIRNYFVDGDGVLVTREGYTFTKEQVLTSPDFLHIVTRVIPGFVTGDTGAESNFAVWEAITDGSFRITVDGTPYNVDAIDFTGDGDMDDVASTIQAALRVATSGTETVVWSTDHFVITSGSTKAPSTISVTSTSTGTVGTDISDSSWLDTGANGTVTNPVDTPTYIYGYIDTVSKIASYTPSTTTTTAIHSFSTDTKMSTDVNGEEVYVANGDETIGYTDGTNWTNLTNAPKSTAITFYDFAGYTFLVGNDLKQTKWSKGNNFNNWTETATKPVDDPGVIQNDRLGYPMRIKGHDKYLFTIYERAVNAYHFEAQNVDGDGLAQLVVKDFESTSLDGITGTSTDVGFVYIQSDGIYILGVKGGDKDIFELSQILGKQRMKEYDMTDARIFYDGKRRIFISCAENTGDTKNVTLVYHLDFKLWTTINGIGIADFELYGEDIYAILTTGSLVKLFDGFDDGGNPINFSLELKEEDFGDINTLKNLENFRLDASLSPSSRIIFTFRIFGSGSEIFDNDAKLCVDGTSSSSGSGVGKLPVGKLGYLIDDIPFTQYDSPLKIFRARKIQLLSDSSDSVPHAIKSFGFEFSTGRREFRHNLTRC